MIETRLVKLPKGQTLELEIHPGFYDKVRQHFGIDASAPVDDDHIRMFVFGSLKTAIDKAESEVKDEGKPKRIHRTDGRKRTRRKKSA